MLFSKAASSFLEYLISQPNFSKHTIKNYDHHLRRFWYFSGQIETGQITPNLIKKYTRHLKKQNLKKSTQNGHLIVLRSLMQYLEKRSIPNLSPESINLPGNWERQVKHLDSGNLRLVVEVPDTNKKEGLRDRSILEILYCTPLKVSQIAKLNRDDADLTNQTLENFPLSDPACIWLETYLKSRKDTFAPLFIRFQGKINLGGNGEAMRLTERSIERIVKKYTRALGFTDITPETFRQNFSVNLVSRGADIKTVARQMGHKHTVTTYAYLKAIYR